MHHAHTNEMGLELMALPDGLGYFKVTWKAIAGIQDGTDTDDEPDILPIGGQVVFTPAKSSLDLLSAAGNMSVFLETVVATVDTDGVLKSVSGAPYVTLIAPDSPGLTEQGWTWTAAFKPNGYTKKEFSFNAIAGAEYDLAALTPVSSSPGTLTLRGPEGPAGPDLTSDQFSTRVNESSLVPDSVLDSALRAAFGRRFLSPTPAGLAPPAAMTSPYTFALGIDPTNPGRVFARNSFGVLAQTDNGGTTWVNDRGAGPAGTSNSSAQKMVVFKDNVYLMITDTASGQVGIYRATNSAANSGAWSWSAALVQTPVGVEGKGTVFNAGSQYLFLGEYESAGTNLAALGGPQLKRSVDGVTWTVVWGRDTNTKHIHSVTEDPYNPGHIYMAVGDTASPSSMYRSTDHGSTWTSIISGANWLGVQVSFSPDWVWLASDRPGYSVAVFDRTELVPRIAATNTPRMAPVPGGASGDRFYAQGYFGAVDPATGVYYHNQSDTSTAGNTFGNFYLSQPGGRLELLDFGTAANSYNGIGEVFITGGRVFIGNISFPTIQPFPS